MTDNITISEAIESINKDKPDTNNVYTLCEYFEFWNHSFDLIDEQTRLKSYYLSSHICTDTRVGVLFYFLDDVFVCYSEQLYRKGVTNYFWKSKEIGKLVKEYIRSFSTELEDEIFTIANLDQKVSDLEYTKENLSDSYGYLT
jgi:hypothetical protein